MQHHLPMPASRNALAGGLTAPEPSETRQRNSTVVSGGRWRCRHSGRSCAAMSGSSGAKKVAFYLIGADPITTGAITVRMDPAESLAPLHWRCRS
jgi:hypothetical protein